MEPESSPTPVKKSWKDRFKSVSGWLEKKGEEYRDTRAERLQRKTKYYEQKAEAEAAKTKYEKQHAKTQSQKRLTAQGRLELAKERLALTDRKQKSIPAFPTMMGGGFGTEPSWAAVTKKKTTKSKTKKKSKKISKASSKRKRKKK